MAEALVFPRQDITIDQYVSEFGIYAAMFDPAPVSFAIGENYKILWGGEAWYCQVHDGSATIPGAVFVGDASAFNLNGNGEPFVLVVSAENVMLAISLNDAEPSQHNLAIYRVTEEEPEREGIVLKDRNGNDVAYYGIETVTFDTTTEGKQQTFTKGVAVEGLEIVPDFSGGDMAVNTPAGSLVKSAVVKKPDALAAENIRNGEEVAGVVGTFIGNTEEVVVELNMADDDQVIAPSAPGKVLSHVVVKKPDTLVPENIAKDVEIGGVVGTHEGGGSDGAYIQYTFDDTGAATAASVFGFTKLPAYCFYNMSSLVAVDLTGSPDLQEIGSYAFYGCSALENISLPNGVQTISSYAFYGCSALKNISLPNGVQTISNNAFYNCAALTDIVIPYGVTTIGSNAFCGCTGLKSVTIPGSVTSWSDGAFWKCSALESATIGSGVTSVPVGTFRECTKLANITLGDTVASLGDMAFYGCTSLVSITIPAALKQIGRNCFGNCSALASATFNAPNGWFVNTSSTATSGTSVSLNSASTAATYLRSTYASYYWKRN